MESEKRYMTMFAYIWRNLQEITRPWWMIILLTGLAFFCVARLCRQRGISNRTWGSDLVAALLLMYLLMLYTSTVICRPISHHRYELQLFWSYKLAYQGNQMLLIEILANYMMLIPLGALFSYASGCKHGWVTLLAGLGMTVLIECSQLLCHRGLFEFDDMLDNMLGVLIGVGIKSCAVALWRGVTNRRKIKT